MNAVLVSVVVPVYNGARFLRPCIDSLLTQDHTPIEVVVVDDGSTDASAETAATYPEVRLLRRPHEGLPATRNAGIEAATADIIGFCDADDTWLPHKASRLLAHLEANPRCDVALCRMDVFFEHGIEWPSWLRPDQARGDLDGIQPTSGLFKRHVFERTGGYREGSMTDFELLIRARTAGCTVEVVDAVLQTRRIHDRNMMTTEGEPGAGSMFRSVREHLHDRRTRP